VEKLPDHALSRNGKNRCEMRASVVRDGREAKPRPPTVRRGPVESGRARSRRAVGGPRPRDQRGPTGVSVGSGLGVAVRVAGGRGGSVGCAVGSGTSVFTAVGAGASVFTGVGTPAEGAAVGSVGM